MPRYARVEGTLIEPLGHLWVAYSPTTGETALLNDESAAILEILDLGAAELSDVCEKLSLDSGLDVEALADIVEASWPRLEEAGLVFELPTDSLTAR